MALRSPSRTRHAKKTIRTYGAGARGVPVYVILHDSTLRAVRGVGERKLLELGPRLLERIAEHDRERGEATSSTRGRGERG